MFHTLGLQGTSDRPDSLVLTLKGKYSPWVHYFCCSAACAPTPCTYSKCCELNNLCRMVTTWHHELFPSIQYTPSSPALLGCLGSNKAIQEKDPWIPNQNTAKEGPENWQMETSLSRAILSVSLDVAIKYLKFVCSKLKKGANCINKWLLSGWAMWIFSCKKVIAILVLTSSCSK